MARKAPQLAKLTRPRLHKAVARERLFALLDEAREHKPAICVVGPPGAGKTTLVASWLDARGIKGIWYQVDPGDADLATFFYYLGEAAKPFTRKGQRPLPLLTPEYLHDVEGFSRRFFRDLFARLPEGATLVLDNYQEVAPEQPFHQLTAQAVDEVPEGDTLIIISRRDPPDCYARLIANDGVTFMEWEDLKLTLQEAQLVALARKEGDICSIPQLHEKSGGWAAGLVLMLESPGNADATKVPATESQQKVFSYFASQILDRVSGEDRDFLMATADLPWVDSNVAEAITGIKDAKRILEDLCRRHLFIHRRAGVSTYQFHALFQEFLRRRARDCLPAERRTDLRIRAARHLKQTGNVEEAFALYRSARDWEGASSLVLGHAQELVTQGRFHTLNDWIDALPQELVDAQSWLAYWKGRALVPLEALRGRRSLEQAYRGFSGRSDAIGEIASAASIIDSIFIENRNFVDMDSWIQVLEQRLKVLTCLPSAEMELRVYSSALIAMLYRQPASPLLEACLQRLMSLIELELDPNGRVVAAISILTYSSASGDFSYGHRARKLVDPMLSKDEVAPAHRFLWHIWLGYFLMMIGEYHEAERNYQAAAELNAGGQFPWSANLQFITGLCSIGRGDYQQALKRFEEIEKVAERTRPQDLGYRQMARAWKAVVMDDPQSATRECEEALRFAERIGNFSLSVTWLAPMIWGLGRTVSREAFDRFMESTLSKVQGTCYKRPHVELLTMKAALLLRENELNDARVGLIEALNAAKALGHEAYFDRICRFVPELRAFATQIRGQDSFFRSLIRKHKWPPPSVSTDEWPWPIRVHTLGRFAVLLDDKPLAFGRKVPRRPISLLKAIIALGEHGVSEDRLIDALWPDEEGDAAHHALALALHRLRRLLACQEAITVVEGVLALNHDHVWTDVRAFDALLEEKGLDAATRVAALLKLYRGSFLADDVDEPWTVSMRERLRSKFLSAVEQTGVLLDEAGQAEQAIALYQRGLDADPLAETFYQGLIRSYISQGRQAEAISTYRRLRHTLSIVLGVQPSSRTEALVRELRSY